MMMQQRRNLMGLILTAAGLVPGLPAISQPAAGPAEPAAATVGTVDDTLSIPVTPQEEAAEVAERERLNREQAEFAVRQRAENRTANEASQHAYEQALREREALIARQQAEYQAALAAVEAERQRLQQEHEAAMARWRADVEACNQGNRNRCARPD